MTYLYVDQFEACPFITPSTASLPANVLRYTDSVSFYSSLCATGIVAGLTSPKALSLASTNTFSATGGMIINLPATITGQVNLAFRLRIDGSVLNQIQIAGLDDATGRLTAPSATTLYIKTDGSVAFNGTSSAAGVVSPSLEYHIELEVNFTTKVVHVYVNEILVLTAATALSSTSHVQVCFYGPNSSTRPVFDNIIVADALIGDCGVSAIPLLAVDGTPTFTPVGAASNLLAVNKTDLDETSYNASPGTNGSRDLFTLDTSTVSDSSVIKAIVEKISSRKSSPGIRNLNHVVKNGASEVVVAQTGLSTDFSSRSSVIMGTAPDGTAWDKTKLTATLFGYEVQA